MPLVCPYEYRANPLRDVYEFLICVAARQARLCRTTPRLELSVDPMNSPIPTSEIHRRPYWMGNRSLGWSAVLATLIGLASALLQANAVESAPDSTEPVVLTRGPVHEAFAGLAT